MVSRAALAARKAAENQLLEAQKLESIGRLAGGIAHDFNNLLFAIRGYAELLAQDLGSDDPARHEPARLLPSVTAISQASEHATALTAQLLALSRQQVPEPVTSNRLVQAAASAAAARRAATKVR